MFLAHQNEVKHMQVWLKEILDLGVIPYVSTSTAMLPSLDLSVFEGHAQVKLLEEEAHLPFHQAYLLSNSLGFGSPDLKMAHWVYIDCVLLQTAVIGFAMPKEKVPKSLLAFYEDDVSVDVEKLDMIPISGQISAMGVDRTTITGYSLFSLKSLLLDEMAHFKALRLGSITKYAALKAYQAERPDRKIRGVAQYDNPALKIHGAFGKKMYIEQPMVPLHPKQDMSFIYHMQAELDIERVLGSLPDDGKEPDFWLHAGDKAHKQEIKERIAAGERFYIKDPIQSVRENEIYLPICVEKE